MADDLPALLVLRRKVLVTDVSVSKTILSVPTYANALHARMTELTQKKISITSNQITMSKKLNK